MLQKALEELSGGRSLKRSTEDGLEKIFKRLGWPFPGEDEEDNSKKFGPRHGWSRELKRRVAELKKGSGAGGSDVVMIGPHDEAALAAAEEHLKGGPISDRALQKTYKAIRRCGKGI